MANVLVDLSPAQRWALFPLMRGDQVKIPPARTNAFRRCFHALALDRIETALRRNQQKVAASAVMDDRAVIFTLTPENLEYLDQVVAPQDKTPGQILALARLLEMAHDPGIAALAEELPAAMSTGLKVFDPELDDWTPPPEAEGAANLATCPNCSTTFALSPLEAPALRQ